jgi:hypothetical protein
MFTVTKVFTIKNQSNIISGVDETVFLTLFYQKLLDEGHISSSVLAENFIQELQQIKIPFLNSGKFIDQITSKINNESVMWGATFDSEASYEEYKNSVNEIFGTNFHMVLDTPTIALSIF